ncbi:hypothetical protein Bpfe_010157 [Biomphalaria pfeifferi]|uniref:Uncharacterized protein n=1 Tax=Biomphalaria pfeifferi TaxID=112525 RepID=A0AAD8BUA1_BIOPF|nr:hypothetical protein Bpfe_010157 [Biomphalaria pfeifferi]
MLPVSIEKPSGDVAGLQVYRPLIGNENLLRDGNCEANTVQERLLDCVHISSEKWKTYSNMEPGKIALSRGATSLYYEANRKRILVLKTIMTTM